MVLRAVAAETRGTSTARRTVAFTAVDRRDEVTGPSDITTFLTAPNKCRHAHGVNRNHENRSAQFSGLRESPISAVDKTDGVSR